MSNLFNQFLQEFNAKFIRQEMIIYQQKQDIKSLNIALKNLENRYIYNINLQPTASKNEFPKIMTLEEVKSLIRDK